jgi:tetratricopeptide (TPR) repeat protein
MVPVIQHPRTGCIQGVLLWGLLLLTAAIYWPGLAGPMLLDDFENLQPLVNMQSGALQWQELLSGPASIVGSRPVAVLSFIANWLTSAGEVWSLKYTNLMIHLLCGTLLFWLAGRLFAERLAGIAAHRWWLALLVAALWLLAPMLVSTVLYIVQRMAQLAALFVLAGLLCYAIGRQALPAHRPLGMCLMGLCFLLFWPLATLSKQNGALLPLLAVIVELGFFERPKLPADRRLVNGLLAFFILVPLVAASVVLGLDPGSLGASYQARDVSTYERLLTEARVLFDYSFNLLMIPGGSPLGLFHDDFTVSRGLLNPPATALAIGAWVALLAGAWMARRSLWSAILFGPVYFLAAHLLESTVLPLELYFEHRNYLPSTGLFLALGVVAGRLMQRRSWRKSFIALVTVVPLVHGAMSFARVLNWRSAETLLLSSATTHPDSPRVHTSLAVLYLGRNELDQAFEHLDRAEAIYGEKQSYAIALHRLNAYCTARRPVLERHYAALESQNAITDTVYTTNALRSLVDKAEGGDCRHVDLARVADIVDDDVSMTGGGGESDRNWALRIYTAKLLALLGRRHEAVEHALVAMALKPTWLEPGLVAIEYQVALEDWDGARRTLAELKRRDNGKIALYTKLIDGYQRRLE